MQNFKDFLKRLPRHWFVAASAWGSKIIVSLVQIISIRELLLFLGEDRYAVYLIAYSLTAWLLLSNFSVSISLQNYISEHRVKKQSYDEYMIAAVQIAAVIFLLVSGLAFFFSYPVQNILLRKFSAIPDLSSMPVVLTVSIVALITTLSSLSYSVYFARHKGYIPNILPAVSATCSMALITAFNKYSVMKHNIVLALLIFTVPQLIFSLIPFILVFRRYFSRILQFNKNVLKSLLVRAGKFHGVTVAGIVYAQTDYIIMSQTLLPKDIIIYNIFMRVFMIFYFIYASVLTASWPVFSEMYVEQRFKEIKTRIKKYILYAGGFIISGTLCTLIFSDFIVKTLAPDISARISPFFISLLGFYMLFKIFNDTFTSVLQSFNVIKILWIYAPFQIIINASAQYFFSKRCGINGIIIGLILSLLLTSVWMLPLKTYKILKEKT